MKEKIITILKSKLKQMFTKVPLEYMEELHKEFLDININREKVLAVILIIVDMALLLLDIILKDVLRWNTSAFIGFSYYHVILLIVPLAFLYLTCFSKENIRENFKLKRILHITINTSVIMLCSVIAFYNITYGKQPFPYTIAVFCIASLILLGPFERLIVYGIPYLCFIFAMVVFQLDVIYKLEEVFFYTLLTIIAYIVSCIICESHVKRFMNNRIIIEKNIMLNDMNKVVQESLQKRTEELNGIIEYEKLRTDFFANISHELRTPLTIISSAQQMLSYILRDNTAKHKPAEIEQYMEMMGQNCNRLLRLISNLIDITKIDAGYFHVNLENHDIVSVIEDITLSIAKYIEDTNINLTFDTEVEEKVVACDPDKIERIMLNLLSNAVKFTPKGGDIFVNIYDKGDRVVVCVKDTGIGVPSEMKDLIFERFVQVDKSTTRKNEGSGIGLSIVRSLVDMHNGRVYLVNEQGTGSEFVFEIPSRTVKETAVSKEYNLVGENRNSQRIKIEFSDIYF